MGKKEPNAVRCKDCLLSGWDVDPKGVWFSCGCRLVPNKIMTVRTAMKFLVVDCDCAKQGNRHGGRPGTLTVFDIAAGKHLEKPREGGKARPQDNLPMDPWSKAERARSRAEHAIKDQRKLDFFGEVESQ